MSELTKEERAAGWTQEPGCGKFLRVFVDPKTLPPPVVFQIEEERSWPFAVSE